MDWLYDCVFGVTVEDKVASLIRQNNTRIQHLQFEKIRIECRLDDTPYRSQAMREMDEQVRVLVETNNDLMRSINVSYASRIRALAAEFMTLGTDTTPSHHEYERALDGVEVAREGVKQTLGPDALWLPPVPTHRPQIAAPTSREAMYDDMLR